MNWTYPYPGKAEKVQKPSISFSDFPMLSYHGFVSFLLLEPDIPMASSIGLASSGGPVSPEPSVVTRETSVNTEQGMRVSSLVLQTLCQLFLIEAPGSSTTALLAGRKRRRNRWSDAPPSGSPGASAADGMASTSAAVGTVSTSAADAAIAAALASLSERGAAMQGQQQQLAGTGGQNLTPEQLQQIKEQIEVSDGWYYYYYYIITWICLAIRSK